ncbi:hypothetical protein EF808_00260 [archaeon]|nr:MAG: hypothetical protein EF808_00260 [archaeon]
MAHTCELCNAPITQRDMVHCTYCKTPFHQQCVREHLYSHKTCPHCYHPTSMFDYQRGAPPGGRSVRQSPPLSYTPSAPVRASAPPPTMRQKPAATQRPPPRAPPERPDKEDPPRGPSKRPRGGKVLLLLNFVIVLLLLASTLYASTLYVGYAPDLSVDTTQKSVLPGQTTDFTVALKNTGNILSRYDVTVAAGGTSMPQGWSVSLLDATTDYGHKYTGSVEPEQDESLVLRVSTSASAGPGEATIRIEARSSDGKYRDSLTVNVTSEATASYELIAATTEKFVTAGETATFNATVQNNGSSTDTYYFQLKNTTAGWSGSLLHEKVTVEPNGSKNIVLTLKSPSSAQGNAQGETILQVTSQNDTGDVKTQRFTLIVSPTYGFELNIEERSKVVLPGSSTTYLFQVQNNGNAADTYALQPVPSLPSGWTYEISKREVTVSPGGNVTVGVTIIVPEGAQPNQRGVVNVTVISSGSQRSQNASFELMTAQRQQKRVFVELFTSANCTYCPAAESALHDLLDNYPDDVVAIEYHLNDSFNNIFSNERASFYTMGGTPQSMFDGIRNIKGGSGSTYAQYEAATESLLDDTLKVRLDLSVTPSVMDPSKMNVEAFIKPLDNTVPSELNVFFVVYENGLSPPGSSKVFYHVAIEGHRRTVSQFDPTGSVSLALTIPEDGGVVVFVQDPITKRVYQAAVW